ncbi:Coproporphyrinogen III oxidase, partial [Ochromonadaceae sp. CCMP2298]
LPPHLHTDWADEYFKIPHRNDPPRLGGIFFDDLNDRDPELLLKFAEENLKTVIPAYGPLVTKHKDDPYTQKNKEWQLMRR